MFNPEKFIPKEVLEMMGFARNKKDGAQEAVKDAMKPVEPESNKGGGAIAKELSADAPATEAVAKEQYRQQAN